jgi:hypothetical protein
MFTIAGLLDLTSIVYPDQPTVAANVVPQRVFVMVGSGIMAVRYVQRSPNAAGFVPVAVFRLVDLDHPTLAHPSANVAAVHTGPSDWRVGEVDGDPVQMLAHAIPCLNGRCASLFSLATQESRMVEMLANKDSTGRWMSPDSLVYSHKQHVGFIFAALSQVRLSGWLRSSCGTTLPVLVCLDVVPHERCIVKCG